MRHWWRHFSGVKYSALVLLLAGCTNMYSVPEQQTITVVLTIGDENAPGEHCNKHTHVCKGLPCIRGCATPGNPCRVTLTDDSWEIHAVHELAHCLNINHHAHPRRR